jgi:two-component system, OmpR family, response regulator
MVDLRPLEPAADLNGSRIGMLGLPSGLADQLDAALKSALCLPSNLSLAYKDPSDPWELYDMLIVWAGEDGPAPPVAELLATSQRWLLVGPEERIRQNSSLSLRADDVVFTPYSLNELLFRIYRTIHRPGAGGQGSSNRSKPLVLVADDDPAMLTLLETVLRSSDWECHFTTDGRRALVMAHRLLPDLMVLDIEMPFVTGLEVLRRIRNTQADSVKVLLLTASSELKHVEEGLALGADDYLAKPFSHVALVHRVRKLLFSLGKVSPVAYRAHTPA